MDPTTAVVAAYRAKQLLVSSRTLDLVEAQWAQVDSVNPLASWARQIPSVVNVMRQGMRASAAGSSQYVGLALRTQGITPTPEGMVSASAFAETAADGRPLGSLLYLPALRARDYADGGMDGATALDTAKSDLLMLAATELADAGRQGVNAGMLADRKVAGYFRQPGPNACARCAILAGIKADTYEAAAFERHPRCQCTAVPAADFLRKNPTAPTAQTYFDRLTPQRQEAIFGKANAQAIREGADPAAVINARRGMTKPGFNWTTTEGTTRRGNYGSMFAKGEKVAPRLTPAAIYRLSSTREEAVAMLRKYGYLI